jgi:WD40 repeat protein
MKRQNRIVKCIIVFLIGIMSISLTSAQEFILGQEKPLGGIFSPDGSLLAVMTATGVLVFDTGSLRLIETIPVRDLSRVSILAFSPDSRYLAWSEKTPGGGVGVWDFSASRQAAYFQLNAFDITDLVFVPGGKLLAVQTRDYVSIGTPDPGTVHLWNVGTWEKHGAWSPPGKPLGAPGSIGSLTFTYNGKQFVASCTRGPVGEWVHEEFIVDVQTLKPVDSHESQGPDIIAFSPDGRFEVVPVNGGNRGVMIRDPQNHAEIALLSDPVAGYLLFGSISPDGEWLATWNLQKEVIIWNAQTWEVEHRLNLPAGQSIAQGFVKGTYWYADLDPTGELRIWDLIAQDRVVGVFPLPGMKATSWGYIRSGRK